MGPNNIRWAFNVKKWAPTTEELLKCVAFIQQEEKERIGKFYFKEDFKSSLVGRILMRKFVADVTNIPYNEVVLTRDARGKPILENPKFEHIKFNVSHQGDYVVLAGSDEVDALGIDVMKMEYKGGKELSEFFRIMERQFTAKEWQTIYQGNPDDQIKTFYRFWCLKESYVKATGTGLNLDLQRINFQIKQKFLDQNDIVNSTELFVDGEKMNWEFHETLLGEDHCVTVAIAGLSSMRVKFQELFIDELIGSGSLVGPEDMAYCQSYFSKMEKS